MPTKRFVITAAQNATPIHGGFWASLKQYCKRNNAELIVVQMRYKNPTSLWSALAEDDDWWDAPVAKYLCSTRRALSSNCSLLADIRIQPTASEPLSGLEGMTGAQSVIVGHPQIAFTAVATPRDQAARSLMSTGACTVPNYTASKAGAKGAFHHSIGAAIVEVEPSGRTHLRHINAVSDGSFHDLDREYHARGSRLHGGVAALVMGDTHADFADPGVVKATFSGPNSIVQVLRPALLVWHDVFDCYSGSHHHKHSPITLFKKHHSGKDNVRAELQRCFDFVDKHSPAWCQNVFVPSNHTDHLARWLEETDPRTDHENALLWAELFMATRTQNVDPFIYLAKLNMKCADRTIFLNRDEGFIVQGVGLDSHGDLGPNGSRGTLKSLARSSGKGIFAHAHTPGIYQGGYQVGTNSIIAMPYAHGSTSWMHTDCILYKNGKRTLLHIVDARWRA